MSKSTLLLDPNIKADLSTSKSVIGPSDVKRGWTIIARPKTRPTAEERKGQEDEVFSYNETEEEISHLKREVGKHLKSLVDVKPWTIANRIKHHCYKRLDMDTRQRSKEQVLDLVALISKHSPFVQAQPLEQQIRLCRACVVLTCKKGQVIVRQGDEPDGFYIILTGKVSIKVLGMKGHRGYKLLTYLGHGKTFGDLAIRSNCNRTASAVAESHTDLLVVDAEDFKRIFGEWYLKMTEDAAATLKREVRVFESINISKIKFLAHSLSEVHFPVGHVFNLDHGSRLYFLIKGTCDLTMVEEVTRRPKVAVGASLAAERFGSRPVTSSFVVESITIHLGKIEAGSFFGESCMFEDLQHGWICRADTDLQVYQVPQDLFIREDPKLVAVVRDEALFRNSYFAGRRGLVLVDDQPGAHQFKNPNRNKVPQTTTRSLVSQMSNPAANYQPPKPKSPPRSPTHRGMSR